MSGRITKKTTKREKAPTKPVRKTSEKVIVENDNDSNDMNSNLENQNAEMKLDSVNDEIKTPPTEDNDSGIGSNVSSNENSDVDSNNDSDSNSDSDPNSSSGDTEIEVEQTETEPIINSVKPTTKVISDDIDSGAEDNEINTSNTEEVLKATEGDEALSSNFFKEEVMTIQNKEVIPEFQRVYQDDTIYQKDLESSLLRLLPLNQQNNLFLQRQIYQEVEQILALKNHGRDVLQRGDNWYKYLGNYRSNIFNAPFVVPVVLDKRRVYIKVDTSTMDNSEEAEFSEHIHVADGTKGIKLENPKDLVRTEKLIEDKYSKNQINFDEYYRQLFHTTRPYINSSESSKGYKARVNQPTKVVRYYDVATKHWENRMALGPFYTSFLAFDEITRQRKSERNIVLEGEDLAVVGFMVLPVQHRENPDGPEYPVDEMTRLTDIDKGLESFYRFAEIGRITNIKSGNNAIITVPNHGLHNRDAILIKDNTSEPSINGCYSCNRDTKVLRVIDNDNFTIDLDTTHTRDLKSDGSVFGLVPLNFTTYNIKRNEVNETTKSNKKGKDKQKSTQLFKLEVQSKANDEYPHGRLYLFDDIKVSDDEKNELISTVLPSIDDVLEIERDSLSNALTMQDIENTLEPYGILLKNLNASQAKEMRELIKKNIDGYRVDFSLSRTETSDNKENAKDKKSKNKKTKSNDGDGDVDVDGDSSKHEKHEENLDDDQNPLSNKYITSQLIAKYYGPYPFLNQSSDSLITRMSWASKQPDSGNLLYTYASLEISKQIHADDKKYLPEVEKELRDMESELSRQKKELDAEEAKSKGTKSECGSFKLDYVVEYSSLKKRDEEYYKMLTNKFLNSPFKNGDYCLIRSTDAYDGQIYMWEDDQWIRDPRFNSERDVCLQSSKSLQNLPIDQTQCQFESLQKCVSSRYYRLYQKYTTHSKMVEGLKEWRNTIKEQTDIKLMENSLKQAENKLRRFVRQKGKTLINQIESNTTELPESLDSTDIDFSNEITSELKTKDARNEKNAKSSLKPIQNKEQSFSTNQYNNPLYNRILSVQHVPTRNRLIYTLIERDGVLIDNWIYSRKYRHAMTCGHWDYLRRESTASTNEDKHAVRVSMLDKFGDRGLASHGVQTCRVCSYSLEMVDYDEAEGLNSEGNVVSRTTVWYPDQHRQERSMEEVLAEQAKKLKDTYTSYRKVDCVSMEFRREMLNLGLRPKQLKDAMFICGRVMALSDKMSVALKYNDLLQIIVDTIRYYDNFVPDLNKFVQLERIKAQKSGKTADVDRLRQMYPVFISPFRIGAIVARLLITMQTATPPYRHGKMVTGCSFAGFDGDNGINFMSCLIKETSMMDVKIDIQGKISMASFNLDNIKEKLELIYQKYRNDFINIKELFSHRENYQEKKNELDTELSLANEKIFIPKRFEGMDKIVLNKFVKEMSEARDSKTIRRLRDDLQKYMANLSLDIIEITQTYIESEHALFPVNPIFPENMCCMQSVQDYEDYNTPVNKLSDGELDKTITTGDEAGDIDKHFVKLGAISRLYFPEYVRHMNFEDLHDEKLFQDLIQLKFLTYCHSGVSKGERHKFNELERCIKCKLSQSEIRGIKYSMEQYEQLLDDISDHHTAFYKPLAPITSKIKTTALSSVNSMDIDRKVLELVDKLFTLTGKSGESGQKDNYEQILRDLAVYPEREAELKQKQEDEKATPKTIITTDNIIEQERVLRLKQYFNEYFRKYVSVLANRLDKRDIALRVDTVPSDVAQEIQKSVFAEYDKVSQFLIPGYEKVFQKLRFKYTIDDIEGLTGIPDLYDANYTNVIVPSSFNYSNAVNALMEILLEQLNEFLLYEDTTIPEPEEEIDVLYVDVEGDLEGEDTEVKEINTKEAKKIIAHFILTILDIIDDNKKELDIKYSDIDSLTQRLYDDARTQKVTQAKSSGVTISADVDTEIEEEMKEAKKASEDEDAHKHVTEVIKEELIASGKEATELAIEKRMEALEDRADEEDITLEQGQDYGDINENDLEDAE